MEQYLNFERTNPQGDDALFSSYKTVGTHMTTVAIQDAYRNLNDYLGWTDRERGSFRKATSHMMRKFFNTQSINAGMPEEIREHMMGHKLKDKVHEAYFITDPEELMNNYLRVYRTHIC